jgi:hypothetical protein
MTRDRTALKVKMPSGPAAKQQKLYKFRREKIDF